ncbi:hypothetical protein B0T14DRAFT_572547 [Immersiella caudata]|uniref:Uncharacterized protein n=1 Tax=Immersiella caudata TaxID=314043 RepID=A0AA39XCI6_9PEZI|nr:hypothetical protein B0T14DRAFT_572547 [Immersiella caudata]
MSHILAPPPLLMSQMHHHPFYYPSPSFSPSFPQTSSTNKPLAVIEYLLSTEVWARATAKKAIVQKLYALSRDALMEACRLVRSDAIPAVLDLLKASFATLPNRVARENSLRRPLHDRGGYGAAHHAMEARNAKAPEWLVKKGYGLKVPVNGGVRNTGVACGYLVVEVRWVEGLLWFHKKVWGEEGEEGGWLAEVDGMARTLVRLAVGKYGHRHEVYKAVWVNCKGILVDGEAPSWEGEMLSAGQQSVGSASPAMIWPGSAAGLPVHQLTLSVSPALGR